MLGLIATIGVCFVDRARAREPALAGGRGGAGAVVARASSAREPLYLAIGILGATVMPHNLYLHSSIVQTRAVDARRREHCRSAIGCRASTPSCSLLLALLINAAILMLAAAAFHATGHTQVTEIEDAYQLLAPIVGTGFAAVLFAIALLASGQSSTFTGTIAGQVIMEGFLKLKIPVLAAAPDHARRWR